MDNLAMPWGDMAYLDTGAGGPTALLLHGAGCGAQDWRGTIEALPASLRVVALDFRAHGRSAVPREAFTLQDLAGDAIAVVDRLALDRVTVAGHSLGGMVDMEAASRCPRIGALVLLEGWSRLEASAAFDGDRMYGTLDARAIERITSSYYVTVNSLPAEAWRHIWASVERFDGTPFLRAAAIPIIPRSAASGGSARRCGGWGFPLAR